MENNQINEKEENNNNKDNNNLIDFSKYKIKKVEKGEDISNCEEITYKVIVIGDPAVGKSTIIQNLVSECEIVKNQYKATIGFDIFNISAHVNEKIITMQIWDTSGLIEFSASTPKLYKNTVLAIVVYAANSPTSFQNLDNWINLLKLNSSSEVLVFIVGNKVDLKEFRKISKEEGNKYVNDNNYKFFIETSALEKLNVKELFDKAFVELYELYSYYKKKDKEEEEDEEEQRYDFTKRKGTFKLDKTNNNKKNKNKTCCSIY